MSHHSLDFEVPKNKDHVKGCLIFPKGEMSWEPRMTESLTCTRKTQDHPNVKCKETVPSGEDCSVSTEGDLLCKGAFEGSSSSLPSLLSLLIRASYSCSLFGKASFLR